MNDKYLQEQIDKFTEQKLEQITHYTDYPDNPIFNTYKNKCLYQTILGAKGVAKSFGRMLITIYKIIHNENFNSCWTRNQYNHIATTLKPTLEKALDFLDVEHNIHLKDYFNITATCAYFNRDKNIPAQKIIFQNWEKPQAFQGITLEKYSYYFGELVIDEPIIDKQDTKLTELEIQRLYETQKEYLPLLISNTILRVKAPDNETLQVVFLCNPFDKTHFIVTDYVDYAYGELKEFRTSETLDQILKNNFIQIENKEYSNNLGLEVTFISKMFVPKSTISPILLKYWDTLKFDNPRLYINTVIGWFSDEENQRYSYLFKKYIYNSNGEIIDRIYTKNIQDEIKAGNILMICDGVDVGKKDNTSWVRIALDKQANIIVLDYYEEILFDVNKKKIKNQIYNFSAERLIELMNISDLELGIAKKNILDDTAIPINSIFQSEYIPLLATDRDWYVEILNTHFMKHKLLCNIQVATRKDTKNDKYSIQSRQIILKDLLQNKKIYFNKKCEKLLLSFSEIAIPEGEFVRDETVNAQIYDSINAFEYALYCCYKQRQFLEWELNNGQ